MTGHDVPVTAMEMPQQLEGLRDLAYNLWWTWTPRARLLFSMVHKRLWATYRNPVQLLINIEPYYWQNLIDNDDMFMSQYRRVMRDFERYLKPDEPTWFEESFPGYDGGPIAYFSTEFGLHESLGIYCGGLGVLSGDHAKAASDLGLPFVGIGPLYRLGYFHQTIDPDGRQHHTYRATDFYRMPVRPMHDATGRDLVVSVELNGRTVQVRVWRLAVGRVFLYLLDTDLPANDPGDRPITSQLYVRGREMRLCQELVLGIAGVRALRALGIEPAVWHINEGHSAFQVLERARELVEGGKGMDTARRQIRNNTVFTTHTPVPAGNEQYDHGLAEKYMQGYADRAGVELPRMMELGRAYPQGEHQPFNLTALAVRFSGRINGVSSLHGEVANQLWHHLLEDQEQDKVRSVTNGVHRATWLGHEIRTLLEENLGNDWQQHVSDGEYWQAVREIADGDLWEAHQIQKQRLLRLAVKRLQEQFARHGKSPEEIRLVGRNLDVNTLTIGFARRFATYKRAGLIFQDFHRLQQIVNNAEQPVQIIFSGKAHPADGPGQDLVRDIVNRSFYSELRDRIFFLEDYDMRVARHMVEGVDLWLNTPRRPREACGTSGMKAAMNGVLNFSIADGWWAEAYNGNNGWLIGNGAEYDNDELQDYKDSDSLYEILEQDIIPCYYERRENGTPRAWVEKIKESMATIIPLFNAGRMIQDYMEQAYRPIMEEENGGDGGS